MGVFCFSGFNDHLKESGIEIIVTYFMLLFIPEEE